MGDRLTIAIIGGGIGGLSAALSLLQIGADVQVYERVKTLGEVGAGLQISPNATKILHRLGLGDDIRQVSVRPLAWHQRRWDDGRTLARSPLAGLAEAEFGYSHYNVHRADLIGALVRSLPPERLHLGYSLKDLRDRDGYVEASFENGKTVKADVLIGADGIHSSVRRCIFGDEQPHFTGCVAYRGLVPSDRVAHLNIELTSQVWMGSGRHFVHYFVRNAQLLNFVAVIEQDSWTRESWTDHGEVADLIAAFEGWHPQVQAILGALEDTFVWALHDRQPMDRWSVGRTTLLGDACHPMLPFTAQGAVQAIEDGAAVAACLTKVTKGRVPEALRRYEALRLPRTARIQGLSAANKLRFHLPDGPAQEVRDAEMARGSTDWSLKAVAWIYGHDAGKLEQPSNTEVELRS